ncbi:MAG: hypothetical protein IIB88_08550 [Chloroflexi bacterium]|nr:hypothetical protein [Chloroflexota bacterium]
MTFTPTVPNTPGGPTKTFVPTPTPCFVTPTPPPAVGGVALGGDLALGESGETARKLWLAVLGAIAVALSGSAWYAHKRWIRR